SGYQTAILCELAGEVISIERHELLAAHARALLHDLGYRNAEVLTADGSAGYEAKAPYDAILVTAGAPRVPEPLKRQLAEGGRLAVPVGPHGHQVLTVVRRTGDQYIQTEREACVFVPLIGREGWPG